MKSHVLAPGNKSGEQSSTMRQYITLSNSYIWQRLRMGHSLYQCWLVLDIPMIQYLYSVR